MYKNVLLIDDDANIIFLHKSFVSTYSFYENIIDFRDPIDALAALITTHSNESNLVLLDLNMPQMTGWEFVDKLSYEFDNNLLKSTTIVIVSSSSNPEEIARANENPNIFAFIEKPLLPEHIEQLVSELKTKKHENDNTGSRSNQTSNL